MKTLSPQRHKGFTLLEIMLVVAIIALLLTTGFYYLGNQIGVGQDAKLMADYKAFDSALQTYENFGGSLPTSEQGLAALVTMPQGDPKPQRWYQLMKQLPKDPWGSEYVYVAPGTHNTTGYDIYSKGKDHVAGTGDDRGNWETALK